MQYAHSIKISILVYTTAVTSEDVLEQVAKIRR
jgi:hypothetical protein